MKLNKDMIHARIPARTKKHMQIIQAYYSKTATAIIEDALEKGLKWYFQQIAAENGYTKEKPLTWEKLAAQVKLSEPNREDDKPKDKERQESQEQENISTAQLEYKLWTLYPSEAPDFPTWLKNEFEKNLISQEQLTNAMQEYLQNTEKFEKPTKTKI